MIKLIFSRLILSIILCLVLIGYIFLFTTSGLTLSLTLLALALPGKLHIEHVNGALLSNFDLQHINYQDSDSQITIESLHVAWNPTDLFHDRLTINRFNVDKANIVLLKNNTTSSAPFDTNNLHWLKFLNLQQATLSSITVTKNNKILWLINHEQITQHDNGFSISTNTPDGNIDGQFSFTNEPHFAWQASFALSHWNPQKRLATLPGDIQATLHAYGTAQNFTLQLDNITGSLQKHSIQGNLALSYQNNIITINPSEIKIADSKIQIDGSLSDRWNLRWKIHIPNISTVFPNSHGSLNNMGEITGLKDSPQLISNITLDQVSFNDQKIKHLTADAAFIFSQHKHSTLTINAVGIDTLNYHIQKMRLATDHVFTLDKNALYTTTIIAIDNQPLARAIIAFPDYTNNNKKIRGELEFHTNSLGLLSDFSDALKDIRGNVKGNFSFEGEFPQLKISGSAALVNGQATLPNLGLTLTHANLQANASNTHNLTLSGNFSSAPGTGQIDGTCDPMNHFISTINVSGNNLRIFNLEHYKILATPNLKITYQPTGIQIQGNVFIPEAQITPTDFSNTLALPDDVVYVGRPHVDSSHITNNLILNITLTLGDHIALQYDELKTHLGGKLQILQNPGTPVTATGELYAIKGTYRAYGKLLDIQQGKLIYTGNTLMNPGLNIRAMREIKTIGVNNVASSFSNTQLNKPIYTGNETINVGVQVQGTAESPAITLVSNPSMSQSDILSYLLFGYPQSQASGANQIGTILNATSAMNLGVKTPNVSGLTEGLQNKLGLNELSVGSTEVFDPNKGAAVATTSFIVGKELARNLYLHYSVGLFNPVSILNLRYQFTKRWAIQSEASTIDSGADILYGFEKD